jgi:hypothetical protein
MIKKEYILNLNKDEMKLILESLLYSSSVDVTGQFDINYCKNFFELAKKIRFLNSDIIIENLELFKNENIPYEDEHSNDIANIFPEIVVENMDI